MVHLYVHQKIDENTLLEILSAHFVLAALFTNINVTNSKIVRMKLSEVKSSININIFIPMCVIDIRHNQM